MDLVGKRAGYAKVLAMETAWLGKRDTQYVVRKTCCGIDEVMSHQALVKLFRQDKMAAAGGRPELATRECFSCASKKRAESTNRKKGLDDLGPAFPTGKPAGTSEWLRARRKAWDIATREAHEYAMRGGNHG